MWEKLAMREKERKLGLLFGCALVAYFFYGILIDRAPVVAWCGFVLFGGISLILLVRCARLWLQKPGPAPVGPLSRDERVKALRKLRPPSRSFG